VTRRLKLDFRPEFTEILGFLRRQDNYLESFYKEQLRWNSPDKLLRSSISEYLASEGAHLLDYEARIRNWLTYKNAKVTLYSYEDALKQGSLLSIFLKHAGIDHIAPKLNLPTSHIVNASLDNRLADLYAAIHKHTHIDENNLIILKRILTTANFGDTGSRALLDWRERCTIRDACQEKNKILVANYFSQAAPVFCFEQDFTPPASTTKIWDLDNIDRQLSRFKDNRFKDSHQDEQDQDETDQ
jgi:hypothetical protein